MTPDGRKQGTEGHFVRTPLATEIVRLLREAQDATVVRATGIGRSGAVSIKANPGVTMGRSSLRKAPWGRRTALTDRQSRAHVTWA